ncbi:MAG: sugar transferase [Pleurocapsa sp.]
MIKRLFDLLLAGLSLTILSPLLVAIAILLLLELPEPIFWVSPRVGKDGRIFNLYNFRTMKLNDQNQKQFTAIGRFIRNYSLDHLPQLFNVIEGNMSLIGFRPPLPKEVDLTDPDWQTILTIKPGMFSLAILGLATEYNSSSYKIKNQLELEYVRQYSTIVDFQILLKSIGGWITSQGNIKARGNPSVNIVKYTQKDKHKN